jgi:hypothetical protein
VRTPHTHFSQKTLSRVLVGAFWRERCTGFWNGMERGHSQGAATTSADMLRSHRIQAEGEEAIADRVIGLFFKIAAAIRSRERLDNLSQNFWLAVQRPIFAAIIRDLDRQIFVFSLCVGVNF